MRWIWAGTGLFFLGLAIAGTYVPLLPTVPFLLLAASCFARSSERLHSWLLSHPIFGKLITDWQRYGAIGRRAKVFSTLSIALALLIPAFIGVAPVILVVQSVVLSAVLLFIWSRPEA